MHEQTVDEILNILRKHIKINQDSYNEFLRYFDAISRLLATSATTSIPIPNEILLAETEICVANLARIMDNAKEKI